MNYNRIIPYDSANGEGWRVSLFVSGCKFHCEGCFNEEAQNFRYGEAFTEITLNTIINHLKSDRIAGLSLLGGDPLWQDIEGMFMLVTLCNVAHDLGKTVWIWSGFIWEEVFSYNAKDITSVESMMQKLIRNCDVWVDGQFELDKKDLRLKWCGSSNQRVIDVKQSLEANKVILYEEGK